jgi:hypothetical protein
MKSLRLLLFLAMIGLSSCDNLNPFGQDIGKKDLYGQWTPVQMETDGAVTEPTVEQRNDYIRFNEDMTFVCLEKSVEVQGEWNFVPMFNVLNIMAETDPDNCIPLTIESVTETELVYRKEDADGNQTKVWLTK